MMVPVGRNRGAGSTKESRRLRYGISGYDFTLGANNSADVSSYEKVSTVNLRITGPAEEGGIRGTIDSSLGMT